MGEVISLVSAIQQRERWKYSGCMQAYRAFKEVYKKDVDTSRIDFSVLRVDIPELTEASGLIHRTLETLPHGSKVEKDFARMDLLLAGFYIDKIIEGRERAISQCLDGEHKEALMRNVGKLLKEKEERREEYREKYGIQPPE